MRHFRDAFAVLTICVVLCSSWLTGCAWHSGDECGPEECQAPEYHAIGGFSPTKDDWVTKKTARQCARDHLGRLGRTEKDYADGFETAFVDLSLGGDGQVPAIPPEKYWAAHYRSGYGHARARLWFEGYAAGVQMANEHGIYSHVHVPTSYVPEAEALPAITTLAGEGHPIHAPMTAPVPNATPVPMMPPYPQQMPLPYGTVPTTAPHPPLHGPGF